MGSITRALRFGRRPPANLIRLPKHFSRGNTMRALCFQRAGVLVHDVRRALAVAECFERLHRLA